MRLKLTIILGLLNLLAFGALYYFEIDKNGEPAERRAAPILPSSITESTRIEITGEAIPERRVLSRKNGDWMLEEPVVWRANPNAIDRIFRALLFLRKDIRFTMEDIERNNQTLADYGLDTPVLSLSFVRDGVPTEIKIGAPTDVGGRFYLLGPSEEEIFVVDKEVLRSVALDLQDLRDKNLFAMDFFSIKEISMQPGNGRNLQIRLVSVEDGWMFEAPIQTRASAGAVDSRLQMILETNIESLQPETQISPSESGLIEPRMRVSIEDGDSRRTFLLGKTIPDQEELAYGKMEGVPTVLTVPEKPFLQLNDALTILREKSFFLFRVPIVTSIQISSGPRNVTLQKLEDQSWQVSASGEETDSVRYPADPGVLSRTFDSLVTLRAVRFVSDAPSDSDLEKFGLDEPQRTVEIIGTENHKLILGDLDPETKLIYAKVEDQPFVYAVPLQIIRSLPVSALAYRFRTLDRIPENGQIKSVKVTDLETGEILLDRKIGSDEKSWTTDESKNDRPLQEAAFAILLGQLRNFKVESYLSSEFSSGIALAPDRVIPWKFLLEAEILLPGSGDSRTVKKEYYLTARIEGTLQGGGSEEREVTFTLTPTVIDSWAELFPARPFPEEYNASEALEAATMTQSSPEEEKGVPPVEDEATEPSATPIEAPATEENPPPPAKDSAKPEKPSTSEPKSADSPTVGSGNSAE